MMEDSCCIELCLKQRCTDREGKIIKINIDDLSLAEMELLKVRSSIHEFDLVKEVCKKHKNQLLRDYSVNFKKCEDPFKKHKTSVKTNLHEVTLDEFKHSLHNYCVLPGQKLCRRCFKECNESKGEPDIIMHKITYETEMSFEEACDVTNESLRLLDCSPLKKHVRTDRAFNHGKRKIEEFTKKICRAVAVALTEPELENDDHDSCLSLIKDIKEKLKICNKQETV